MAHRENMKGIVSPRHCPKCGYGFSKVHDSQDAEGYVRRRRTCRSDTCKFVWVTYEIHRPSAKNFRPPSYKKRISNRGRHDVTNAVALISGDRSEFAIPHNRYEEEDHPHEDV